MVSGMDYIGIVPEGIMAAYCYSCFSKEDCVGDFMNLPLENQKRIIEAADWHLAGKTQ